MKTILKLLYITVLTCLFVTLPAQEKAEKNGWRLAIQSYTFHLFTLTEAFDKAQELGIHYMEVYPGHKLGGEFGDQVFGFQMDQATLEKVKSIAASKGIQIIATGVVVLDNPEDWETQFRFAKDMGMEFITAEPALNDWNLVDYLVKKYGVRLAVHNHPKPSGYWNPELLLQAISGRNSRIGACADVGHWRRESLNSLDCLNELQGKIVSLHFKDIAAKKEGETEQQDVIWGTGILDVKGMLTILKAQNFKGVFSIEYENNWDNSVPDIRKCIQYYQQVTDELF